MEKKEEIKQTRPENEVAAEADKFFKEIKKLHEKIIGLDEYVDYYVIKKSSNELESLMRNIDRKLKLFRAHFAKIEMGKLFKL